MTKVLKADASVAEAYVRFDLPADQPEVWLTYDLLFDDAALAVFNSAFGSNEFSQIYDATDPVVDLYLYGGTSPSEWVLVDVDVAMPSPPLTGNVWRTLELHYVQPTQAEDFYVDGTLVITGTHTTGGDAHSLLLGQIGGVTDPALVVYMDNVKLGTTRGASDLFSDDFESGNLSAWTSTIGDVSVVDLTPPTGMVPGQRVGIAFNDGPLEPDPTWTWLDDASVFPPQFVAGYDTQNGRRGLISQTETGTATVYVNDHELGLFDDRNTDSPYYGLLDGKQIILQLWDPVELAWEPQFRGWIENYSYDIDGSAVANPWADPEDRQPLNASIQIECVDMFDMLAGFGLTPGLAGDRPPSGMLDGVYYPEATDAGRMIEVLADVGIDSSMTALALGNAHVVETKYDPDESALAALRDAADAELPFIGNIYCDRRGRFCFRGRYSRFDPDGVAGEPLSTWDFTRWAVGDGAAIVRNPARAQMRVLSFERSRQDIINAGLCYPQGLPSADMPNQVYTSPASMLEFGKHDAPPLSDLLIADVDHNGDPSPGWGAKECFRFIKLLVKNKAQPREAITALQVKAVRPTDPRAEKTWAFITRSDIGHIVNVAVGYPGGTGFTGDSPIDDYYIEGRTLRVRPLNPDHDYVEYDVNVSPAVWSMDTHGVFPPFTGESPIQAEFTFYETDTPGEYVFSDESTPGPSGPIVSWAWDFDDGGSDTAENPTYTYAANGTYNVTLLVTGSGGDGTDIETRTLKLTDIP